MLYFLMFFRLPLAERRNYTNVFNALYRICKEEGLFALWRVSRARSVALMFRFQRDWLVGLRRRLADF